MKLYKALKLRKNLIGDIAKLKQQIKDKNSYLKGSKNGENFSVKEAYDKVLQKIQELTSLKYCINEANREIQSKIYLLGEYKALIGFWKEVSVTEGSELIGYSDVVKEYVVQIDESGRDKLIEEYQNRVDALQDEIDEFNYNTNIPWGDMTDEELDVLEKNTPKEEK